jgi:3-hydroxymyristoyl/3-hydroxydecanoyl-(acyl carrier protein) dehydratase
VLTLPEIDSLERGPEGLSLNFHVSRQLEYFEGHFPEVPLLPGVIQVGWAVELARLHLAPTAGGMLDRFRSLANLKFMRVIQPGAAVRLHLRIDLDRREMDFEYSAGGHTCSSGRVLFH